MDHDCFATIEILDRLHQALNCFHETRATINHINHFLIFKISSKFSFLPFFAQIYLAKFAKLFSRLQVKVTSVSLQNTPEARDRRLSM